MPVSAETVQTGAAASRFLSGGGWVPRRQVRLVQHHHTGALADSGGNGRVLRRWASSAVEHQQQHVGAADLRTATLYPEPLYGIVRPLGNSGRINERDGDTVQVEGLRQDIAGGAGNRRHDGAVGFEQRIEQARLAGVRAAHQHRPCSLVDEQPARGAGEDRLEAGCGRGEGVS